MTGARIDLEINGAVAVITIRNPGHRNALTLEMYRQVPGAVKDAHSDPTVRVIILRGAGGQAFSAGGDISEFRETRAPGAAVRAYNEAVLEAERAIAGSDVPVIAMVAGACVGGGCALALAADLRIVGSRARFGITAARMGLAYGLESVRRLSDVVGQATAGRMLLTATLLDAREALRVGLATELVEDPEARAGEIAATIAGLSPVSLRTAKRFLSAIAVGQREEDAESMRVRNESFDAPDYAEGVRAFLAKEPPRFAR